MAYNVFTKNGFATEAAKEIQITKLHAGQPCVSHVVVAGICNLDILRSLQAFTVNVSRA